MLRGQLYAIEYYTGRGGETESGFFIARNDEELVAEFDNNIKVFQFMGPAAIFGFHDDEAEVAEPEEEQP